MTSQIPSSTDIIVCSDEQTRIGNISECDQMRPIGCQKDKAQVDSGKVVSLIISDPGQSGPIGCCGVRY